MIPIIKKEMIVRTAKRTAINISQVARAHNVTPAAISGFLGEEPMKKEYARIFGEIGNAENVNKWINEQIELWKHLNGTSA